MAERDLTTPPMEEPLAGLERELIAAYLTGAGQDTQAVLARHDEQSRRLLVEASEYAAGRLAEIEARLHYIRGLRGQE